MFRLVSQHNPIDPSNQQPPTETSCNMPPTRKEYDLKAYRSWDKEKLAHYVSEEAGLGQECEQILVKNSVTGQTAPSLTDADLREMGFTAVGERHRVYQALSDLRAANRKQNRETILWQGTEFQYHSWYSECTDTCCGLCPKSPAKFTLSRSHLTITTEKKSCCLCCKGCCGTNSHRDNVDLSHVRDVDHGHVKTPCFDNTFCCGESADYVKVTSSDGVKMLVLSKGEGDTAGNLISNQVEEAQLMRRGEN